MPRRPVTVSSCHNSNRTCCLSPKRTRRSCRSWAIKWGTTTHHGWRSPTGTTSLISLSLVKRLGQGRQTLLHWTVDANQCLIRELITMVAHWLIAIWSKTRWHQDVTTEVSTSSLQRYRTNSCRFEELEVRLANPWTEWSARSSQEVVISRVAAN